MWRFRPNSDQIQAPGASSFTNPEQHPINPVQHQSSTSSRPGKFADLSKFAEPIENNDVSDTPKCQQGPVDHDPVAVFNRLSVRHIVHIEDSNHDSRIHDRIMLVIRTNPSSYTCLTFCSHDKNVIEDEHCRDHAKLTTEDPEPARATGSSLSATPDNDDDGAEPQFFTLHVSLEYGGCRRQPRENAYLNLRELWNIESGGDVKFAILGKADKNWPAALQKITEIFEETVGDESLDRTQSKSSELQRRRTSVAVGEDSHVKGKGKGKTREVMAQQQSRKHRKSSAGGDGVERKAEEGDRDIEQAGWTTVGRKREERKGRRHHQEEKQQGMLSRFLGRE